MSAGASRLNIRNLSSQRIHAPGKSAEVQNVDLSIIDATVGGFGSTEMILLYDACRENERVVTAGHLKGSLQTTLNAYPYWCGRLRFSDYDPKSMSHLHRFGRFVVSYGGVEEPGVEFVIAHTAEVLSSLVPTAEDRAKTKVWDATGFPGKELVPSTVLSHSDLHNPSAPSLIVQVTHFSCGGMAVAVKIAHPLADAHCLSYFVRDWAAVTLAAVSNKPSPTLSPVFDPQMLDRAAAGDIDAEAAESELSRRARELPCHRYDWWASVADCPFPTQSKEIPKPLENQPHDEDGERMPWSTWDLATPVQHILLHFSGAEISAMQRAAATVEPQVSKQDAVVAHIWNCVNRAREMTEDDEAVYLDYTLGLRNRTNPPLGERFVGSPILLTAIQGSGSEVARKDSLAHLAARIRRTVAKFTPDAVAAHLHDKLYDQYPQRLWQAFLGKRQLLTTSWIHTKIYDVDFGCGSPRYVEAVMPHLDGLFQLMEAKPLGQARGTNKRKWSDDGIDCQLCFDSKTVTRMLEDPLLRKYV